MRLKIFETKEMLGTESAKHAAQIINEAISRKGGAVILLSTGASQFPFFNEFIKTDVDWSRVEMFHLDEYVGISKDHPASFNKYLTDRFVSRVPLGKYHLIDGEADAKQNVKALTELLAEREIDLGMIGIGENAHIAFNDPPADFEDTAAYKVVTLADRCLDQQIGEGWFKSREECYKQAISMTCSQIMKCRHIISVVPYAVKAEAVRNTFENEVTEMIPATLLKRHPDAVIYCDKDSSALLDDVTVAKYSF